MSHLALDRNGALKLSERQIQKACVDFLRAEGWFVFETHSHDARKSMGTPGQPDLVALTRSMVVGTAKVLFIEVKRRRGGRVRESQTAWHKHAAEQGFQVLTVRDVDELRAEVGS